MRFDEVLRTWSTWFESEGIRYAVVGGLAVHAWGHSRLTYDAHFAIEGTQQKRVITFAESRVPIDVPDMEFLLSLPETDVDRVRDLFERAGLLRIFDVISSSG